MARMVRLRRHLDYAHTEVARLAAASYMGGVQDPMVAILGNEDPRRVLAETATIDYLARQRSARQQALERFMAAEQRAEQAARAKIADLSRLVAPNLIVTTSAGPARASSMRSPRRTS